MRGRGRTLVALAVVPVLAVLMIAVLGGFPTSVKTLHPGGFPMDPTPGSSAHGVARHPPPEPSAPPSLSQPTGTCPRIYSAPCTLAVAGSSWSLIPPRSWCVDHPGTTPQPGTNGSNSSSSGGGYVSCSLRTMLLGFNVTQNSTLSGTLWVNGSFQVWLVPAYDACAVFYWIADVPVSCPVHWGNDPWFSWNASYPAGSLNLTSLTFDFGGATAVLPPLEWCLGVVDLQPTAEVAVAQTDLGVDSV
ncbi:MAG: hypothetical protein ACHQ2Y_04715 [Candidatus Lutacidiplasmatales archaeon]